MYIDFHWGIAAGADNWAYRADTRFWCYSNEPCDTAMKSYCGYLVAHSVAIRGVHDLSEREAKFNDDNDCRR